MTDIVEKLERLANWGGNATHLDYEGAILDAKAEIERLRAALREIAGITPRVVEVQTDYGTDKYKTLVDDNAITIARRALEGRDD